MNREGDPTETSTEASTECKVLIFIVSMFLVIAASMGTFLYYCYRMHGSNGNTMIQSYYSVVDGRMGPIETIFVIILFICCSIYILYCIILFAVWLSDRGLAKDKRNKSIMERRKTL